MPAFGPPAPSCALFGFRIPPASDGVSYPLTLAPVKSRIVVEVEVCPAKTKNKKGKTSAAKTGVRKPNTCPTKNEREKS
ncbi:hypothetical protein SEA_NIEBRUSAYLOR_126 [Mycobacterium phage NiebruSaylor]|nr:hypothetical protein SEA_NIEBRUSAYLOR_126 [Mycobacterium phage NiebruSaylor]